MGMPTVYGTLITLVTGTAASHVDILVEHPELALTSCFGMFLDYPYNTLRPSKSCSTSTSLLPFET
jgi:hypothetical protein